MFNRIIYMIKYALQKRNVVKPEKYYIGDYFYPVGSMRRFSILSTPNKENNFMYDVHEYNFEEYSEFTHYTFSVHEINNVNAPVWKYSMEDFLETIYCACDHDVDIDISKFQKVLLRFNTAATKIQQAWRIYDFKRKQQAVDIITQHVLHHLYRPGGPLCKTQFS